MRPRIIDLLNNFFGVEFFKYFIPTPSQIYGIAFIITAIIFINRITKVNRQLNKNIIFTLLCGITALFGAKLGFVLLHLKSYIHDPLNVFSSGTISWGAYLGLFLFVYIYSRNKWNKTLNHLDIIATCIPMAVFIGRWSCFLNGDDFGTLSSLPWAVRYPYYSIPFGEHFQQGIIPHTANLSASVHPNQLYLSINGLLLFFIMYPVWKINRKKPGYTFAMYLILYGSTRFFLEIFRYYGTEEYILYLNPSQWISLITLISGLLIMKAKNYKIFVVNKL